MRIEFVQWWEVYIHGPINTGPIIKRLPKSARTWNEKYRCWCVTDPRSVGPLAGMLHDRGFSVRITGLGTGPPMPIRLRTRQIRGPQWPATKG